MTFNDMQATILSEALISYIQTYYDGNKDALLEHFHESEEDAAAQWRSEFPRFYDQAARHILGENANVSNIAFFSKV